MKLKPCPFCGTKPESGVQSATSYGVWCPKCRAKIEVYLPAKMPLGCVTLRDVEQQTLGVAKERWNRRV